MTILIAAIVGLVLVSLPLVNVHGVESALILGVTLPPLVAGISAAASHNTGPIGNDRLATLKRVVLRAWFICLIPIVILGINALFRRSCAPLQGAAFMFLGPFIGCTLAAVVGAWVGVLMQRKILAVTTAVFIPITALFVSLMMFYFTPSVYLFGLFAGYFPGTLYDVGVTIRASYISFRLLSALLLIALSLLFVSKSRWSVATASICGLVFCTGYAFGPDLGIRSSKSKIIEALGKVESSEHCKAVFPRETSPALVDRLMQDCDFYVDQTAKALGIDSPTKINAYFFRNANEKQALMGAGRTMIAKPWRREVYVQMSSWPHSVFRHEIVHAVAADISRGPFKISSTRDGLWPNQGLIEGLAVALASDIRDELTADQWSKAMLDRNQLPRAKELMGVRFSRLPARKAYAAAGSLLGYAFKTKGAASVVRMYKNGKVDDLSSLETGWHAFLKQNVVLDDNEDGVAERGLTSRSIFSRVCPHKIARLHKDLAADRTARDTERALQSCSEILSIDENDLNARVFKVRLLAKEARYNAAQNEIDDLIEKRKAPNSAIASALDGLADGHWKKGNIETAKGLFEELLTKPQTDGEARNREVKLLALSAKPKQEQLLKSLFVGETFDDALLMHVARELDRSRKDGLGAYLEARLLSKKMHYDKALSRSTVASKRGLPTKRLRKENARMRAVALYANAQYTEAREAWKALREKGSASIASQADEWLGRIEHVTAEASP